MITVYFLLQVFIVVLLVNRIKDKYMSKEESRKQLFDFLTRDQKQKIDSSIDSCLFSNQVETCHNMIDGCISYWIKEGYEYDYCIKSFSHLREKANIKTLHLIENE